MNSYYNFTHMQDRDQFTQLKIHQRSGCYRWSKFHSQVLAVFIDPTGVRRMLFPSSLHPYPILVIHSLFPCLRCALNSGFSLDLSPSSLVRGWFSF